MASIAPKTVTYQEGNCSPTRGASQEEQKSATQRNLEHGHYFQCCEVVLQSKLLSFRAKCVYAQLLCHARHQETCYPGHATLARELGKSVDTIQRGLRELREAGLIKWKRRGLTKTNLYTIVAFTEVPALNNFLPEPKPQTSGNQKKQDCGNLMPQKCGTNQNSSKNTQVETDEASSNSSEGMVEVQVSCSHAAMATRNPEAHPEGKTEHAPATASKQQPNSNVNPSSPHRGEPSKTEIPPSRAPGRQRQNLTEKDEVKRENSHAVGKTKERDMRERPQMPGRPFTQEDMDVRIRERLARERARTERQATQSNPLPGIIRDEDWNKLEQDHPTASSPTRVAPMPVYPRLQQAIEEISDKLGDFHHAKSNITHTENIRREANVPLDKVLDVLSEAYHATRVAEQKDRITKRDEQGRLVKMSYFFAVLRQKVGLPPTKQPLV